MEDLLFHAATAASSWSRVLTIDGGQLLERAPCICSRVDERAALSRSTQIRATFGGHRVFVRSDEEDYS